MWQFVFLVFSKDDVKWNRQMGSIIFIFTRLTAMPTTSLLMALINNGVS